MHASNEASSSTAYVLSTRRSNDGRGRRSSSQSQRSRKVSAVAQSAPSLSLSSAPGTLIVVGTDADREHSSTVTNPIAGPRSSKSLSEPLIDLDLVSVSTSSTNSVGARFRKTFDAVRRSGAMAGAFVLRRAKSEQQPRTAGTADTLSALQPKSTPRLKRFLSVGNANHRKPSEGNLKRWTSTRMRMSWSGNGNGKGKGKEKEVGVECGGLGEVGKRPQIRSDGDNSDNSNVAPSTFNRSSSAHRDVYQHDASGSRGDEGDDMNKTSGKRDSQEDLHDNTPTSAGSAHASAQLAPSGSGGLSSSPQTAITSASTLPSLSVASKCSRTSSNTSTVIDNQLEDLIATMYTGEDVKLPDILVRGTLMEKVSEKKSKSVVFKIDPDGGYLSWPSKKTGIIAFEDIKEIRSGAEAHYYREQFQKPADWESKWITIIYLNDAHYKTLHIVAPNPDVFRTWDKTLRSLYAVRKDLMSGLGHTETRQAVWERRYWKGADDSGDKKLDLEEVYQMCLRLGVGFSKDEVRRRFEEADRSKRGCLDFEDFRVFVKGLKERKEVEALYGKVVGSAQSGGFGFEEFERFMREEQKSTLDRAVLETIFRKYTTPPGMKRMPSLKAPAMSDESRANSNSDSSQEGDAESHPGEALDASAASKDAATSVVPTNSTEHTIEPPSSTNPNTDTTKTNTNTTNTDPDRLPLSSLHFTIDSFTSFLLSSDNSAFAEQGKVWQDMSRPLSEYYISSSHNTYLVGHQLVGVSTIEGYIRALLQSCRSVEIDIYDGDPEPVIYHGKTLTSKVSLREVCQAIAKYAFVTSPYPIIISAEVHCTLPQQELIAQIMRQVFGEALVTEPILEKHKQGIDLLPSPEQLKGRVLLKAKNLFLSEKEGLKEKQVSVDPELTTSTTSSSENDWSEFRRDPIKEIKGEFLKAKNKITRARSRSRSPARSPSPARFQPLGSPPATSAGAGAGAASPSSGEPAKVKMSLSLVALLVYTVGVKCRGFNKKESYATEHLFSLSERTANKVLKQSAYDLVKHNKTHLVRIYPNGTRLSSSNFEPHKYWRTGAQLVAINCQTFDTGYMINHAMFQRNGRAGYVLKPNALRNPTKEILTKLTKHYLDIDVISAQQLPHPRDAVGREIIKGIADPFVEVTLFVPDWTKSPFVPENPATYSPPQTSTTGTLTAQQASTARSVSQKTSVIKNNGFNPMWNETLSLPFDCIGDMFDLVFVRFAVREPDGNDDEPLAVYCVSLASLQQGYRHLPLHDTQMSQYLFSTLFVKIGIRNA